jgi:hypothetical protein
MFGPEKDEGTREWRKLHNEKLYYLLLITKFYSGDQIKKKREGQDKWNVWERGEMRTELWWGRADGKRPHGRPMHRWVDNFKMDL